MVPDFCLVEHLKVRESFLIPSVSTDKIKNDIPVVQFDKQNVPWRLNIGIEIVSDLVQLS